MSYNKKSQIVDLKQLSEIIFTFSNKDIHHYHEEHKHFLYTQGDIM